MLTEKAPGPEGSTQATRSALPSWLVRLVCARRLAVVVGLLAAILLPEIAITSRLPSVRVEQLLLPYALLVFWVDHRRGRPYKLGVLDWTFAALELSTLASVIGAPLILHTRLSLRDFYELLKPALYFSYYRFALSAFRAASGQQARDRGGPTGARSFLPSVSCPPFIPSCLSPSALLLTVLLTAGGASALFGIFQYFDWLRVNAWLTPLYAPEHHLVVVRSAGRVVGTLGNPNYFGVFCAIVALASLTSFWLESHARLLTLPAIRPSPHAARRTTGSSSWRLPVACCLAAAAATTGLVFSGSRTALLALLAGVAALLLLALSRRLALRRLAVAVVVLAVLLGGSIALAEAFPHGQVDYLGRLNEGLNLHQDASFGLRLARWRSFLAAWLPQHATSSDIHTARTSVHATGIAAAAPTVRARDQQRKADLLRLARAIDAYHQRTRKWPPPNALASALVPAYLPAFPLDPSTGQPYADVSTATGYSLSARLEDASDPDYPVYGIGSSPNYLLNADLEQGSVTPDNWDAIPGTTYMLEHGDALFGTRAIRYHGDPAHPERRAGVFQQHYFGRPGGDPFAATVWLKLLAPAPGQLELYSNVVYTDGDRADPLTRTPVDMSRVGVWQKVSLPIQPAAGKDISFLGVYVISEGFSGEALLDGFQLVDGPVPLTFALTREAPASDALSYDPEARLRRSPIIGVGPEKAAQGGSVDDEYLLYAARYGVVGITLYLALYLGTLALAVAAFLRSDGRAMLLPALIAATVIAFLVFNLTAGSFYELQLMAIFWLLCGAALATPPRDPGVDATIASR